MSSFMIASIKLYQKVKNNVIFIIRNFNRGLFKYLIIFTYEELKVFLRHNKIKLNNITRMLHSIWWWPQI